MKKWERKQKEWYVQGWEKPPNKGMKQAKKEPELKLEPGMTVTFEPNQSWIMPQYVKYPKYYGEGLVAQLNKSKQWPPPAKDWGEAKSSLSKDMDVPNLTCGKCGINFKKEDAVDALVGTRMLIHLRQHHGLSVIDAHLLTREWIKDQWPEPMVTAEDTKSLNDLFEQATEPVEPGSKYNWKTGKYEKPKRVEYRTQKARGVMTLKRWSWDVPEVEVIRVEKLEEMLNDLAHNYVGEWLGKFVRPCPVRPRHGFVESRVVKNVEELKELVRETREADGEAELLRMPLVDAEYGGVWTEGRLVVGKGRDGATAGKECVVLPAIGDLLSEQNGSGYAKYLRQEAGITEESYVEMLWRKLTPEERHYSAYLHSSPTHKRVYVQLRNGPKLEGVVGVNWVPEDCVVREVVKVDGQDLMEWERLIGGARGRGGVCVWHPGGSLASHYAVHAVLAGVPVMVSREPVVGETLSKTVGSEKRKVDLEELRKGFIQGLTLGMSYLDAAMVMLAGAHHASVWMGQCDRALGVAMGAGVRLTIVACLGEGRHWGKDRRENPVEEKVDTRGRNEVYKAAWDQVLADCTLDAFHLAMDHFLNSPLWPSTSHGGFKWYRLGLLGTELWNTVVRGEVQGSERVKRAARERGWEAGEQCVEWFNQLVHAVHNGGWAFNKYVDNGEMGRAAELPVQALVKAGPDLWRGLRLEPGVEVCWERVRRLDTLGRHQFAVEHVRCERCRQWGHETYKCTYEICAGCGVYVEKGHVCPSPKLCLTCKGQVMEWALKGEMCPECCPPVVEPNKQYWLKYRLGRFGPKYGEDAAYDKMLCRVCELPWSRHLGAKCLWTKEGTREGYPPLTQRELKNTREIRCRWWEAGELEKWEQNKSEIVKKEMSEQASALELAMLEPILSLPNKVKGAPTPKVKVAAEEVEPLKKKMTLESKPMLPLGMKGGKVTEVRATLRKGVMVHVQFRTEGSGKEYGVKDVWLKELGTVDEWATWSTGRPSTLSMAGSSTKYWTAEKFGDEAFTEPKGWYVMGKKVLPLEIKEENATWV